MIWVESGVMMAAKLENDSNHEYTGDLGPVRGVTTETKAYPEAPYSERSYSYLYLQLLNIYVIRLNIYVISKL